MSCFAFKGPLRKAVVLADFSYRSAEEMFCYISEFFKDDGKKQYHLLQLSEIEERYHNIPLPVKGSTKLHMICFHTNGSVQAKVNSCFCEMSI